MAKKLNHEIAFRGEAEIARLKTKQIVICGAGALGSNLADLLVRQGVSLLRVIDFDRVETHNISTQVFSDGDVGALKVAALKNRIFRDTGVEIEAFDKELTSSTIRKCFKNTDLVVDAFDNSKSRALVYDYCKQENIPCIHLGLFEGYGECAYNEHYTVPQDPPEGTVDVCDYPLARNLIMLVVSVGAEEIVDFCIAKKPRKLSWSITLKDLSIQKYR